VCSAAQKSLSSWNQSIDQLRKYINVCSHETHREMRAKQDLMIIIIIIIIMYLFAQGSNKKIHLKN